MDALPCGSMMLLRHVRSLHSLGVEISSVCTISHLKPSGFKPVSVIFESSCRRVRDRSRGDLSLRRPRLLCVASECEEQRPFGGTLFQTSRGFGDRRSRGLIHPCGESLGLFDRPRPLDQQVEDMRQSRMGPSGRSTRVRKWRAAHVFASQMFNMF